MKVGRPDKIALEDIHYLIRRDAKKYARVKVCQGSTHLSLFSMFRICSV